MKKHYIMPKSILLSILLLLVGFGIKGQTCGEVTKPSNEWKSHSNWFFGNGILADFSNVTSPFLNTTSSTLSHQSYEGTSVLSDDNGNVLYYTNGVNLWKSDGSLVTKTGTTTPVQLLAGNENGATDGSSAVEGVMFVKHPENPDLAYIFTIDDEIFANKGFHYYTLVLSTGVISDPVRINDHNGNPFITSEQMAATFASNGKDIWISVIRHPKFDFNNNSVLSHEVTLYLYSYKLSSTSLSASPVVSELPAEKYISNYTGIEKSAIDGPTGRGSLKFSDNGERAALSMFCDLGSYRTLSVFDFDVCTGEFKNAKVVGAIESEFGGGGIKPGTYYFQGVYNLEFSPNGDGLYFISTGGDPGQGYEPFKQISYLDLTLGTEESINKGYKGIMNVHSSALNDMKIGPDGKLYIGNYNGNKLYFLNGDLDVPFDGSGNLQLSLGDINLPANRLCGLGFSNMFLPPTILVDNIEIEDVTNLNTCSDPVYLKANWECQGGNVNSTCATWSGPGISNSSMGVFNPSIAGVGSHEITFDYDGQIATKTIIVTDGGQCSDPLGCEELSKSSWQWKTHSNWYFGGGMLMGFDNGVANFDNNDPAHHFHTAYEGTSTISDKNGNLLYYTNGRKIWKANSNVIAGNLLAGNEGGLLTSSGNSAVQGVMFVKHPQNPNIGYVFTVDDNADYNYFTRNGLNYSVVDLLAGTVSSPIRLSDEFGNAFISNEYLAATLSSNKNDIWITTGRSMLDIHPNESGTTRNINRYLYSYKLTSTGVSTSPVVSLVKPQTFIDPVTSQNVAINEYLIDRGAMNFSWDGSKAVMCSYLQVEKHRSLVLLDFNNCTGQFSNQVNFGAITDISSRYKANTNYFDGVYDVEFSPNGNGIYFTAIGQAFDGGMQTSSLGEGLFFADISSGDAETINQSVKLVNSMTDRENDVKLGPDGNLYISNYYNTSINLLSGDLNAPFGANGSQGMQLVYSSITLPDSKNSARGFSNMYVPPSMDEVVIDDSYASQTITICSAPIVLNAIWSCSGKNVNQTGCSSWQGVGITDGLLGSFDPKEAGVGVHTITFSANGSQLSFDITVESSELCTPVTSCNCENAFKPKAGGKYVVSAWVKEGNDINVDNYLNPILRVKYNSGASSYDYTATGPIVDGWQRINQIINIPAGATDLNVELLNNGTSDVWFDDIRFQPFNSSMVTYVYDTQTYQLVAELDDENFKTEYVYDTDGNLIRTNVETEDGVRTISESRSHVQVRPTN